MRILGDIGNALARILEADGGGVRVDELRDTEGVHLTYDIGRLAESELISQDTRAWDTGDLAQSTVDEQTITDLPPIYMLMGISVVTDDPTRLNRVYVIASDIGVAGSVRDELLLLWVNGDATVLKDSILRVGDLPDLGYLLIPPAVQTFYNRGDALTYGPAIKSRQGAANLRLVATTTAFGAGTVRVTGHATIGFFRRGRFLVAARPF